MGHGKGAIWDLSLNRKDELLFSAGSDGSVGIWDYSNKLTHLENVVLGGQQIPTSISSLPTDTSKIIVGYSSSTLTLVDVERGTTIQKISPCGEKSNPLTQINQVVAHPKIPLAF